MKDWQRNWLLGILGAVLTTALVTAARGAWGAWGTMQERIAALEKRDLHECLQDKRMRADRRLAIAAFDAQMDIRHKLELPTQEWEQHYREVAGDDDACQ